MNSHSLLTLALAFLFSCARPAENMEPPSSRADELKATAKGWFEAFNMRDVHAIRELYADSAVLIDPDHPEGLRGNDAIAATYDELFKFVPDVKDSITTMVAEGDHVAVEFISKGTSEHGPFTLHIFSILTFDENNKIERDATYYDPR